MDQEARKNAYIYCKLRDRQFALYDEYAKSNGMLMKTLLVANVLYYAREGLSQREICQRVFQSKQTVSLIVKELSSKGYVTVEQRPGDGRTKQVSMTEAGRAWCGRVVRHITRSEDRAMALLTAQEQEQLVSLSRKFTEQLTRLMKEEGDEDGTV